MTIPMKWKLLMWKIMWRACPTKVNVQKRGIEIDPLSPWWKDVLETEQHLFRDCTFAKHVWAASMLGINARVPGHNTPKEWVPDYVFFFQPRDGKNSTSLMEFILSCYAIWGHRNEVVYQGIEPQPLKIMKKISSLKEKACKYQELWHESHEDYNIKIASLDGIITCMSYKLMEHGSAQEDKAVCGFIIKSEEAVINQGQTSVCTSSVLQTEAMALLLAIRTYYKFCEGKPAMPIDDWRTLDFPPCNLAYELVEPWPMVDKLQAFVYEMKQKKKNDDSVFHPEPNNLELMEFF
ncbi:unnamed protein product [Amaranthus hypochondriacus]